MKKCFIFILFIILSTNGFAQNFFSFSDDYRIIRISGYTADDDSLFISYDIKLINKSVLTGFYLFFKGFSYIEYPAFPVNGKGFFE